LLIGGGFGDFPLTALEEVDDGGESDGFDEVSVEVGLLGELAVMGLAVAGHGDDEGGGEAGLAHGAAGFVAIEFGEADIEEDDMRVAVEGKLDGLLAVVCGVDFMSFEAQEECHAFGGVAVVIDDEDAQAGSV
jgi:hypothetical protein